ncbi:AAA domain-containing protein [Herbihabitans rhizosphaerae]|uniref:AAA domain-containing protein n=1 Tax=Herbihabitans rhizosphaerae TaxID=1872711 RepID=A0A4Q7KLE5_9PSEU|nr:AAA family ATPase [Herbihabitans rhizosphaerae]RZS37449.1 AAA domain-containing protein [Herbihabitans rhizosphaerae]
MLLWINGPFGGGKTQVAHELHRRVGDSFVCDPELLGFGLHRMIPRHLRDDFQDLPVWRSGVLDTLDGLAREYDGVIIVPMTMVVPAYFEQIVGGLREAGHEVVHVSLLASRETVLRRLRWRAEGARGWAASKVDTCLDSLRRDEFRHHVHTDTLTVPQVADRVAELTGLRLAPPSGRIAAFARRRLVTLRHVRPG